MWCCSFFFRNEIRTGMALMRGNGQDWKIEWMNWQRPMAAGWGWGLKGWEEQVPTSRQIRTVWRSVWMLSSALVQCSSMYLAEWTVGDIFELLPRRLLRQNVFSVQQPPLSGLSLATAALVEFEPQVWQRQRRDAVVGQWRFPRRTGGSNCARLFHHGARQVGRFVAAKWAVQLAAPAQRAQHAPAARRMLRDAHQQQRTFRPVPLDRIFVYGRALQSPRGSLTLIQIQFLVSQFAGLDKLHVVCLVKSFIWFKFEQSNKRLICI